MHFISIAKSPRLSKSYKHKHDFTEIVLNLCGKGNEILGEEEHPFSAGSISLIPPEVPHNKILLREDDECWQDIGLRFYSTPNFFPNNPCSFMDDEQNTFRSLFSLMLSLYLDEENHDVLDYLLEATSILIAKRLLSHDKKSELTMSINHFIAQNYIDPDCNIQAFIDTLCYNSDYVRRIYKKEMQTTPHQHLLDMRLKQAKQLLLANTTPQCSVQEAAFLSGFSDANHFCHIFKQKEGVTPSQYRKKHD